MRSLVRIGAICVVLSLAGTAPAIGAKAPPMLGHAETALINGLAPSLDSRPDKGEIVRLRGLIGHRHPAVSALATAILFRHDPDRYRRAIFDKFAIRDYRARARGIYNIVGKREVTSTVGDIERLNRGIKDKRATMLLAFIHYRGANKWMVRGAQGQRLSVARFFRGALLASALKGSGTDALKLTNAIDRATQKDMGY